MNSENNEALIQHKEDGDHGVESQAEIQEIEAKSIEILKSALKIFKSNPKFMLLMLLSILPFFVSMVFSEIKLQNSIIYATSKYLGIPNHYIQDEMIIDNYHIYYHSSQINTTVNSENFLSEILQLLLFYLFLTPVLEFFSMIFTTKIAVKLHESAGKPSTIREVINQRINLKGPFVTYVCIHFLSTVTLLGLVWVVSNHSFFSTNSYDWYFDMIRNMYSMWNVLVFTVHAVMFLGLLYKYLEWSAFWNMGMVISVVSEEQIGIGAFGMSSYYGQHCKETGFQLMLGFFVFSNVPRLFCLYVGLCDGSVAGVLVTCGVMMMVSVGNLVKWIAFVLYFNYCKDQIMEKKVDDQELGKGAIL